MKTVALRYGEGIAPDCGTIAAHSMIISSKGTVWYGKFGTPLSNKVIDTIMNNDLPRILLIQSGGTARHWAYVSTIQKDLPDINMVPPYYHDKVNKVKTWFRISSFEPAEPGIMSRCIVASSRATLSNASKHSMSPYFIIEFDD